MPDMRIAFAGSGNIATHLAIAFKRAGFEINCIYSRNKVHAVKLASKVKCAYTTTPADLKADLIVIAVNDDAINLVSDQIVSGKSIVVHTSGSVGLDVLSTHKNRGVFYPLQTFSPGRRVDFNSIPLCIEASSTPVKGKLFSVEIGRAHV